VQMRLHQKWLRDAKKQIDSNLSTSIAISRKQKHMLREIGQVTGLPMGAILTLAITGFSGEEETRSFKETPMIAQKLHMKLIMRKRERLSREVKGMESVWKWLSLLNPDSEKTLGYRVLQSFFDAYHELEKYGSKGERNVFGD